MKNSAPGFVLVALLLSGPFSLFAQNAVIRTERFDIIYPPESAETAALLADVADGFADSICLLLDTTLKDRIPVYVNPRQKELNAYFTADYYNRIVIYDALPVDGSLSGSRDEILKVFYHEMVHLVSLNMRTPFWQFMADVFGDALTINGLVTMPLSFLEGATVSFESRDGEGRLNDPLVLHTLRQAKIDGAFLSFKDTAGSRDSWPAGRLSYYYGGAFSSWLQNTRGMEKYAELWKRGGGFNPFMSWTWTRFYRVYGMSIDQAWEQFRESIEIPSGVKTAGTRVNRAKGGILSSLASGPDGIVWSDANDGRVFFRANDGRVRALFASDGNITRLSLSDDGSVLLVSSFGMGEKSSAEKVRVFDMKKKKFTGEAYGNLRDASFAGDAASICGVETSGQRSALVVFSRAKNAGDYGSVFPVRTKIAEAGPGKSWTVIFSPVWASAGKIAFIGSRGPARDIVLADTGTLSLSRLDIPGDPAYIRYLQSTLTASGRILSFCWAGKNDMYRWGLYRPDTGSAELLGENLSGGVFWPVADRDGSGLFYISSRQDSDSLMHIGSGDLASASFVPAVLPLESGVAVPAAGATVPAQKNLPAPIPWNPLPWLSRGLLYPFVGTLPKADGTYVFGPQLNFMSEDPTETFSYYVSASVFADPAFIACYASGLFALDPVSVSLTARDSVMPGVGSWEPYRETSGKAKFSRSFYLDAQWMRFDASTSASVRGYSPSVGERRSVYDASWNANSFSTGEALSFSAIHQARVMGRTFFPVTETGVSAAVNGYFVALQPEGKRTDILQGRVTAKTPLVPLSCTLSAASAEGLSFTPGVTRFESFAVREYAWNEDRLYPLFTEYDGTEYASVEGNRMLAVVAEVKPCNLEIQRGIPFLPLYANRATLLAGFRAAWYGDLSPDSFVDSAYLGGRAEASAVIGVLANVIFYGEAEYAVPLRAGRARLIFTAGFRTSS